MKNNKNTSPTRLVLSVHCVHVLKIHEQYLAFKKHRKIFSLKNHGLYGQRGQDLLDQHFNVFGIGPILDITMRYV